MVVFSSTNYSVIIILIKETSFHSNSSQLFKMQSARGHKMPICIDMSLMQPVCVRVSGHCRGGDKEICCKSVLYITKKWYP